MPDFTPREAEILELLEQEIAIKEIAERLGLHTQTVLQIAKFVKIKLWNAGERERALNFHNRRIKK